jgi:ferrous iron transport protein A
MSPLGLLAEGEKAEIIEIREKKGNSHGKCHGHCHGKMEKFLNHAECLGLRIGKVVEMLQNGAYGPVLIKVDDSRIGMGRGMAMKILVRRIEK